MEDRPTIDHRSIAAEVVRTAWVEYGDARTITALVDISATVSTNKVYRVTLSDGHEVIAKTTLYGSYVYFRQDHRIVQQWIRRLANTRYRDFLAPICLRPDGEVFTARVGETWVVFYEKTSFYDFLPKILSDQQVACLGREMARFHKASAATAPLLVKSWKGLGSDLAILYDVLGNPQWRADRGLDSAAESLLRHQCDQFFTNAERLGYHQMDKLPLLLDWNIGNFSVGLEEDGFKFFSRWDYDWFRVEPRAMDFYFCARVVRAEGDQETFSYTTEPFFEPRFMNFLRAYHQIFPLADEEILFFKEAYRAFLLNYVMRIGEHFFRPEICARLQHEALTSYFPALDGTDFSVLVEDLKNTA